MGNQDENKLNKPAESEREVMKYLDDNKALIQNIEFALMGPLSTQLKKCQVIDSATGSIELIDGGE